MLKVYTKIDKKLAMFEIDTYDVSAAILRVRQELGTRHKSAIVVSINGSKTINETKLLA